MFKILHILLSEYLKLVSTHYTTSVSKSSTDDKKLTDLFTVLNVYSVDPEVWSKLAKRARIMRIASKCFDCD